MFLNVNEAINHVSMNLIIEEDENMVYVYKYFSQVVGLLIIVTNLSVVVTSGLILKKAVQPKSTYMLLGNISLADSILGVAMVASSLVDQSIITGARLVKDEVNSLHTLCMIIQGMRMCPAVVSILSISLIATDRYVFLLHGLYYKTWVSTKRVRISIACTWILGILFTVPGWMNINNVSRCYFIDIFPLEVMLTLTIICFMNIAFVTTLYIMILRKAVDANNTIQKAKKMAQTSSVKKKKLENNDIVSGIRFAILDVQSLESVNTIAVDTNENEVNVVSKYKTSEVSYDQVNTQQFFNDISNNSPTLNRSMSSFIDVTKLETKCKENKKCRAIAVVILTTSCFIITWLPFMISLLYFGYFCERIYTQHECLISCQIIIKPLWALALLNSLLNPFIYAWWHQGFRNYVRSCYNKCLSNMTLNSALRLSTDQNRCSR